MPPPVLPAHAPINIRSSRMVREISGQVLKSVVAYPVVVIMEQPGKPPAEKLWCISENMVNIAGDDKNCNTDDSEIIPYFFHLKSLSKFFCDNEKVSIKVNAK